MRQKFNVILKILKYCYLGFLGIYLIFIFIHRISIDRDILGYRITSIINTDMSPKYNVEDVVLVKKVNLKDLKVGDDISYVGSCCGIENMVINHRILKIDKNDNKLLFTTKGINFPVEDPQVEEKQIIGKIVGIIPVINFIHHILVNQLGFFLIVFCPLVIVIVVEILETLKDIKQEKEVV